MHRCKQFILVLALALAPAAASAAGWGALLLQGPTQWFNGDDMKLLVDTAREALESAPVGKTVDWNNPKTRNSGATTVLAESTQDGRPCRTIRVDTQAKGMNETMRYVACREPDGRWGLTVAQ
jgi:surface antigen